MAHITLSIPDEIYEEMKKHPEIKWSEIARRNIIEKTLLLMGKINSKNLFDLLPNDTKISIEKSEKDKEFYNKVKKEGLKRRKYLTQA